MASETAQLLLQINATTELLKSNLAEADRHIATFEQHTEEKLSLVDKAFERTGEHVKEGLSGIGKGFVAFLAVEQLAELAKQGLETAGAMNELAQQIGITAEDLQVYRFAASQVGVSHEEMDRALQRFTKSLSEARAGVVAAKGVFHQLGFTDDDIKHLDAHAALMKTADGISEIKDRVARAAPEVALFGKAGQQLDPLLAQGSKGINQLAQEARDLGIVLNADQIKNAEVTSHKLEELKDVLGATIAGAVSNDAAAILEFVTALEQLVSLGGQLFNFLDRVGGGFQVIEGAARTAAGYIVQKLDGGARYEAGQAEYKQGLLLASGGHKNVGGEETEGGEAGGKSYSDPAALAAAQRAREEALRKAAALAKAAAERTKRSNDENARLDDAYLAAQGSITADTVTRAQLERAKLEADTAAKLKAIDDEVATGKLNAADAPALKAKEERNAALQADAINQRENVKLEQEQFTLASATLGDLRDLLSSQSSLATTARERRDIALRILAAEKEDERNRLKAVADDEARPLSERHYDPGAIKAAKEQLGTLDSRYDAKTEVVKQGNAGNLDSYRRQLHENVDDVNNALDGVKVDAFKGLEDGLVGLITGTQSVAAAFKSMAQSIIADLARIVIEKSILGALGIGTGGGGDILGKLFGGGKATGGAIDPSKFYLVGEKGPELFAPGASGSIIPNAAIRAPSIGSLAGAGGGASVTQHFDLRGVIIDRDVYADMQRISGAAAAAAYKGATEHTNDMFRLAWRQGL